jgi:hypothetical protein
MGATSIKFKGVDAMRRKLQTFKMKFPEKVATALKVEAEIEATEVRKRTPVYVGPPGPGKPIPGLLRASIRVVVSPTSDITFPIGTAGGGTATHFSVGVAASGASKILYSGTLAPNVALGAGITPKVTTATTITED